MKKNAMRCTLMTLTLATVLLSAASFSAAQTTPADDRAPAPAVNNAQPPAGETPAPPKDQEAQKNGGPTTQNADKDKKGGTPWQLIALVVAMFVLFFWMGRKPRKEEQRRKEMLSNLKKGDKITTIGGIVGTIIEVRDDEFIVKVDEGSNTRMRFARWAIRQVGETKADEGKK